MNLYELIVMVQKKNDLNRKRRRFYYIWSALAGNQYYKREFGAKRPKHKSFTMRSARDGYDQARLDMKAMTAEMRAARKELNVVFDWSDHGSIKAIYINGEQRITEKEFPAWIAEYHMLVK